MEGFLFFLNGNHSLTRQMICDCLLYFFSTRREEVSIYGITIIGILLSFSIPSRYHTKEKHTRTPNMTTEYNTSAEEDSTTVEETDDKNVSFVRASPSPLCKTSVDKIFIVERILAYRRCGQRGLYLIKWHGWPETHNSWEPTQNIIDKKLIRTYHASKQRRRRIRSKTNWSFMYP